MGLEHPGLGHLYCRKTFETSFPVALSVVSFVSFLTKVMSERTISLEVGYDEFAFGIVVMVSKSAHS